MDHRQGIRVTGRFPICLRDSQDNTYIAFTRNLARTGFFCEVVRGHFLLNQPVNVEFNPPETGLSEPSTVSIRALVVRVDEAGVALEFDGPGATEQSAVQELRRWLLHRRVDGLVAAKPCLGRHENA